MNYSSPAQLFRAGVKFAISEGGGAEVRNLPYNAGMAAAFGLPKDEALKSVTLYPAQMLGVADKFGSIEAGKVANLVVTDGDLLEAKTNTKYLFIDWANPVEQQAHRAVRALQGQTVTPGTKGARSRGMRMRAPVFLVSLVTACAVPILVSSPRPGTPATSPLPASSVSASAEVIRLTNVYRSGKGLGELGTSPGLTEAARLHAEQMARFQQLAHTISDARYPTLHDRLAAAGYAYAAAGENIAWNRPDADDVMNTWLNSTGHRANILDSAVTEIGVAVARSARGDPYWVQVFGRPR